ncbi:hypothetical protein Bcell_3944 [Evansella cellulosilytica DSM 2522]|uniref:Uncharacterized protein n=1 Tax=Evansella cellulosilytica (strain ATCC 21833 / DSM 2522 / FERM P-1141 / JCM 9156 / N-4) TaxID=649639 RepID=E6TVQ0_EVAC2|nr:hypothetical protein Bcell_3944 [Evansella cellulosilytica DSM 2522]
MRVLLELIRIIFIFAFLGVLLGIIPHSIYLLIGINTEKYAWSYMLGIFILIFVLYRNKLQFSGWYKGKGREKLPKALSKTLTISAIILLLSPPMLHLFFN